MPRYDIRQSFSSLPRFNQEDIDANTLNRLVRTIEQNLFQLDLNVVPSYTTTERNSRKFSPGGLIFNTTIEYIKRTMAMLGEICMNRCFTQQG
jgi:hypothetical protein